MITKFPVEVLIIKRLRVCILSFFLRYNWLDEMAMKLKINCLECLYFSEAVLWEIPMVTVLNLLIWVFCIQLSGATMFNLSILTSDMWAVVIRIFFYKQQVFISKLCLILLSCYIDGLNPSFLSLMHGYEVLQLFQANASHLFTICDNRMKPDLILIPPVAGRLVILSRFCYCSCGTHPLFNNVCSKPLP